MTVFHVIMSFTNYRDEVKNDVDKFQVPKLSTLGFKKTFWNVFSDYFELTVKESITWLGVEISLGHVSVLLSDELTLDGMEGQDVFLVFRISTNNNLETEFSKYKRAHHASDSEVIDSFFAAVKDQAIKKIFDGCKCKEGTFPSMSISSETASFDPPHVFPCFFAFYYYSWLIFQRLERAQNSLIICNDTTASFSRQSSEIINHRIRLININRYFLSMNRTQIHDLQVSIDKLIERYKLKERYDRHLEIHKDFEEHINNLSKFAEAERSKALKLVFNVIAYIAIPFGIFGALSQIDLGAVVYLNPELIIKSKPLWLVLLFSFLVPSLLFGCAYLVDKAWGKLQRRRKI